MNETNLNPEDAKLRSLLREMRIQPGLPPRFEEGVWRRIESAEANGSNAMAGWLDALIARVLRPKVAFVLMTALVFSGAFLGVRDAADAARAEAQVRYVTAVNPNALH